MGATIYFCTFLVIAGNILMALFMAAVAEYVSYDLIASHSAMISVDHLSAFQVTLSPCQPTFSILDCCTRLQNRSPAVVPGGVFTPWLHIRRTHSCTTYLHPAACLCSAHFTHLLVKDLSLLQRQLQPLQIPPDARTNQVHRGPPANDVHICPTTAQYYPLPPLTATTTSTLTQVCSHQLYKSTALQGR